MADRSERRKPGSGRTKNASASRGGKAPGGARPSAAEREKAAREQRLADRSAKHRQDKVEAGKAKVYVVKSGDSLSKIAKEQYGDASRWSEIFEANKDEIKDPNLIRPGQELRIP